LHSRSQLDDATKKKTAEVDKIFEDAKKVYVLAPAPLSRSLRSTRTRSPYLSRAQAHGRVDGEL